MSDAENLEPTYYTVDLSDPKSIEQYAKQLEGMTFQDVLDLGIVADGVRREYGSKSYKGGMGNLIEERFFGYRANSDAQADFAEAGVELKVTCFDVKKDGDLSAGERLVLSMIPHDEPVSTTLEESHMWQKSRTILLVYYRRDRDIPSYEQEICYVALFTPPEEDMQIIRRDYEKITRMIQEGRADELSESLTDYLGACTKGATAEKSLADQYYDFKLPDGSTENRPAKRRAFCLKRQYMDHILHTTFLGGEQGESIVKDASLLCELSFEEYVSSLIAPFVGMSDKEIAAKLGVEYTGNKAQWSTLVMRMLDVKTNRPEEFEKAGINFRAVRIEENGKPKENMSLSTITFMDLVQEEWEDAPLHDFFEETRFFFVVFRRKDGELVLTGSKFWNMPQSDIEGPLRDCWQQTKDAVLNGLTIKQESYSTGGYYYTNNLPGQSDNPVAHVRPHAKKAAYRFADGTEIGNVERDGDELPDGRAITKQSFWLNRDYIAGILGDI